MNLNFTLNAAMPKIVDFIPQIITLTNVLHSCKENKVTTGDIE